MVGSKRAFFQIGLRALRALILVINGIVILSLLTIHFVIKDSSYDASLHFYAFPLPIIISIVSVLSIVLQRNNRKFNLIIAGLLTIIWLGRSFRIQFPKEIKETDLEIVFWNASRDNGFEDAFLENEHIPDILVLVESQKNDIEKLQLKHPEYYFYRSVREIYVFSKKPLVIESETTSTYKSTVVNFKTSGINFYAIDVMGSHDVPRQWEIKFVNSEIK